MIYVYPIEVVAGHDRLVLTDQSQPVTEGAEDPNEDNLALATSVYRHEDIVVVETQSHAAFQLAAGTRVAVVQS